MATRRQDYSEKLFDVALTSLQEKGKYLSYSEKNTLEKFIYDGMNRPESFGENSFEKIGKELRTKLLEVASPYLSISDILKKLCPLDPFC